MDYLNKYCAKAAAAFNPTAENRWNEKKGQLVLALSSNKPEDIEKHEKPLRDLLAEIVGDDNTRFQRLMEFFNSLDFGNKAVNTGNKDAVKAFGKLIINLLEPFLAKLNSDEKIQLLKFLNVPLNFEERNDNITARSIDAYTELLQNVMSKVVQAGPLNPVERQELFNVIDSINYLDCNADHEYCLPCIKLLRAVLEFLPNLSEQKQKKLVNLCKEKELYNSLFFCAMEIDGVDVIPLWEEILLKIFPSYPIISETEKGQLLNLLHCSPVWFGLLLNGENALIIKGYVNLYLKFFPTLHGVLFKIEQLEILNSMVEQDKERATDAEFQQGMNIWHAVIKGEWLKEANGDNEKNFEIYMTFKDVCRDPDATMQLSVMYRDGVYVRKDLKSADDLLRLAAEYGSEVARDILAERSQAISEQTSGCTTAVDMMNQL